MRPLPALEIKRIRLSINVSIHLTALFEIPYSRLQHTLTPQVVLAKTAALVT